jgi:hypothetical protein
MIAQGCPILGSQRIYAELGNLSRGLSSGISMHHERKADIVHMVVKEQEETRRCRITVRAFKSNASFETHFSKFAKQWSGSFVH